MVSFLPADGGRHGRTAAERAVAVAEGTRLFTLAESLGGVESLIELPAAMTHMSVAGSPLEVRRRSCDCRSASRTPATWSRTSRGPSTRPERRTAGRRGRVVAF